MPISEDTQGRSPSNEVELFELTGFNPLVPSEAFYFCGLDNVTWQGIDYAGMPCAGSGFEITGQGFPRPKLTIGNFEIPQMGVTLSNIISTYDDFIGAVIIRRTTLEMYLDGQPTSNPLEEIDRSYWRIEQKLNDDAEVIQWELSFMGLENMLLPRRTFEENYCSFDYRGEYCNYTGAPVAKLDNTPTSDLSLDRCSKTTYACGLRLWPGGVRRFGGTPGARVS
jgi:lambda family phage minor tail protein L